MAYMSHMTFIYARSFVPAGLGGGGPFHLMQCPLSTTGWWTLQVGWLVGWLAVSGWLKSPCWFLSLQLSWTVDINPWTNHNQLWSRSTTTDFRILCCQQKMVVLHILIQGDYQPFTMISCSCSAMSRPAFRCLQLSSSVSLGTTERILARPKSREKKPREEAAGAEDGSSAWNGGVEKPEYRIMLHLLYTNILNNIF